MEKDVPKLSRPLYKQVIAEVRHKEQVYRFESKLIPFDFVITNLLFQLIELSSPNNEILKILIADGAVVKPEITSNILLKLETGDWISQ